MVSHRVFTGVVARKRQDHVAVEMVNQPGQVFYPPACDVLGRVGGVFDPPKTRRRVRDKLHQTLCALAAFRAGPARAFHGDQRHHKGGGADIRADSRCQDFGPMGGGDVLQMLQAWLRQSLASVQRLHGAGHVLRPPA